MTIIDDVLDDIGTSTVMTMDEFYNLPLNELYIKKQLEKKELEKKIINLNDNNE